MTFLRTHVNHPRVVQTVNAEFPMVKAYALVCLNTADLHQTADRNVSLALNALRIKCVKTKNVYRPVLAHVETTQSVESSIIAQYARANNNSPEIHSRVAMYSQVNKPKYTMILNRLNIYKYCN